MGNTGNARFTSPHLHFGIYTLEGPVDPFPYVNPNEKMPEKISSSLVLLGKMGRNKNSTATIHAEPSQSAMEKMTIQAHTVFRIEAATSAWYRISLPDGRQGYIRNNLVAELSTPIKKLTMKTPTAVFDRPDSIAPKKTSIPSGEMVDILANFDSYYFVNTPERITGWIKK